jgi:hypothetical protein
MKKPKRVSWSPSQKHLAFAQLTLGFHLKSHPSIYLMAKTFPTTILYYFLVSIIKFTEWLPSFHRSNNIGRSYLSVDVARMRERGRELGSQWGSLNEGDHFRYQRIERKIILKWILRKYDDRAWSEFISLKIGIVSTSCEHSNKPSGSVKCWDLISW